MAINIKNERTVALARELAEVRGLTLTSAIEEALEARLRELHDSQDAREARAQRRRSLVEPVLAELHESLTPGEREALRTAQDDMYDANGLPVW
ncbi:type II toxin-antitoxin system VapB family antitoxin [Demequina sp.]|uniref:type II toxin-antitoxin system VapB family antitoxin n=1 Tax=Demequina sp. TaxID=2050685 RepID=UPI003D0977AA